MLHPVYGSNGVIGFADETNANSHTIVVGRVGSYCGSLHYSDKKCWVTDNAIRANPIDTNDAKFLFYLLQTLRLNDWRAGSGQPLLNQTILSSIPVTVPDPTEQRAIAHILGTLDGKIELNRRMNETLEAVARALFKSWFVDFDPVRAKAALRNHAPIIPPLRGSRGDKGVSPQASRWGESGATQPPRPWPDIKRQYAPKTLQHAQTLRQNQTNAEGLLWHYLRNKQLGGYKFRRQQPIGPYIADFACLPEKLLIELDGGQHADPSAPDEQRDRFLRQQGYRVLRFWNHEVFADCFGVLERVYAALADPPPHQPAPDGLASATPPQGGSDWSVDRARAYLDRMDPEIAALFPDCFVDSEFGEIPAGWEVGKLGNVAENPRRGVQPNDIDLGASYIALEHMPKRCIALSEWGAAASVGSNKYVFRQGEFLFGKLRPYFHKIGIAPVEGVCSTDIVVIAPNANLWSSFVLLCISSDEFVVYTDQTSTGTKMPRTSWQTMKQFEIRLPPESITARFQEIAQPMLDRIIANCHESRSLVALRNALLRKLISGEVRIPETEKLV